MGIGALGIFGGIGRGIMMGQQNAREQDAANQLKQIRDYQIGDLKRTKQMRDEEMAADSDTAADANGIQAASKATTDNVNAQSAANSSLAQSFGNAIKSGVSQAVLPGANPTPSLAQMSTPTSDGAPLAGTTPAAATPDTGIQAAADNATGAATPNGSSNLANSQPAAAGTVAQPITPQQSYTKAWEQKAAKIAAIHDKYGDHAGASAILKSANDRSMAMYDMQLTSAMRDYYGGNFDTAAGKLSTLYNLSQPDGSYVDVKSAGGGNFTVTQYDKNGNAGQPQTIGQQQVEELAQTTMSSAERAKLASANLVARSRMHHDDTLLAAAAGHDKTKVETTNVTDAGKTTRNTDNIGMKERDTDVVDKGKTDRTNASLASRERNTDVMAGARNAGKPDPNLKAASDIVKTIAKKSDLTSDPDILTQVGAQAESNVKAGMAPAEAASDAWDKYQKADTDAQHEAVDAANTAKNKLTEFGTAGLEARGDPGIVKSLKAAGRLTLGNYQQAYAKQSRAQKLGATSAPTTPAPAAAAPRGKLVTGADGSLVYQPQ